MIRGYPSLFLLVFVVAGIVAGYLLSVPLFLCLLVGVGSLVLAALLYRKQHRGIAALLAGLALAMVAAISFTLQFHVGGSNHLRQVLTIPTLCQVFGQVDDWPELRRGRTEITVKIDSLSFRSRSAAQTRRVDGRLLVKVTDTTTSLQRGDRIALSARLYPVRAGRQDDFDYGRYLNLRGIFAQAFLPTLLSVHIDRRPEIGFWPLVDEVREMIQGSLDRNLSPVASALARGFLIGETRDIPPDIYGMFRDSGTLHLLAVSGANVALVIIFFLWVMRPFWLGPATRSVILLIVIAVFAGVSYGDPSVMRASIMAALILGARLLGRPFDLNNIVAVTALVVLLMRPAQLFDVGFQLSFVTAWGLVFVVPRLAVLFQPVHDRRWYRWLVLPVIVAVVAQIFSTPLIALYFERIPVISLAANLVIVPLVSVGVIGTLALLVADLIWPLLGAWVGSLVNLWLNGVVMALHAFGGENMPVLRAGLPADSDIGPLIVGLAYLLLVFAAVAVARTWARKATGIVLVVAVNVFLITAVVGSFSKEEVRLRVERVPGGVSVLITANEASPADLILTGLSRTTYSSDASILTPRLRRNNVEKLRHLVVLGADFDAMDDILRLAGQFSVDTLWVGQVLAGMISDIQAYHSESGFVGAVVPFGGQAEAPGPTGYYLGEKYVGLRIGKSQIDIVDRPIRARPPSPIPVVSQVLIIGGRWNPDPEGWLSLDQAGYTQIVCAEIEQREKSVWPDVELNPDAVPPDYVQDLSRLGSVRIGLSR